MSSPVTALQRFFHSASSPVPRADRSSREIASSLLLSSGSPAREPAADRGLPDFSSCSSSSTTTTLASECRGHTGTPRGSSSGRSGRRLHRSRGRRRSEIGPLGAGVAENRDLVALLDAEVGEPERERPDRLPHLAEAAADPGVVLLVADRGAVPIHLRCPRQEIRDRGGLRSPLLHHGESSSRA